MSDIAKKMLEYAEKNRLKACAEIVDEKQNVRLITEINYEFQNKYPRLYPVAESYGYTIDQIDSMMDVISGCKKYDNNMLEHAIRSIIVRQKCDFEELVEYINEYGYFNLKDSNELDRFGGKYFREVSKCLIECYLYDKGR